MDPNRVFNSSPCKNCGGTLRLRSNGGCVVCHTTRSLKANRALTLRLKKAAIDHYGGKCVCCGESNTIFLNMDHIGGGGAAHRRSLTKQSEGRKYNNGGVRVYRWLRNNGYPEGYRVLCFNCNFAVYHLGVCPHQGASK